MEEKNNSLERFLYFFPFLNLKMELSLNEIVNKEEIVLFDTNICTSSEFIRDELYHARDYVEINLEKLNEFHNQIESFLDFISHKNVYTIAEVFFEVKCLHDIIADKIRYLDYTKSMNELTYIFGEKINSPREFNPHVRIKKYPSSERRVKAMHELQDTLYKTSLYVKKSLYEPVDLSYDNLINIVINAEDELGINQDSSESNKYTDEKLIATSF